MQVWVGSERGGGNPLLGFELLLDLHPDPTTLSNSFEVWSLQEDWEQHLGHLLQELQNTSDLHTKHCSHILMTELCLSLQVLDLCLSFAAARLQKVQEKQQMNLHSLYFLAQTLKVCPESGPA